MTSSGDSSLRRIILPKFPCLYTSTMIIKHITIFFVIISIIPSSHIVNALCPVRCTCHNDKLSVECRESGLEIVPITLNPFIHELILEKNSIKSISSSFNFYGKLSIVDLSYNQISALQRGDFASQEVLSVLLLSHNRISHIARGAFAELHNLKVLTLSFNNLESIHEYTFSKLKSLEKLDLSHNIELTSETIHSKSFDDLHSLKILHFEGNKLSRLPPDLNLGNVTDLHLAYNHFGSVLRDYSFTMCHSLTFLSLEGNQIDTIEPFAFSVVNETLNVLDLSSNLLDTIPTTALSLLGRLQKLSLNRNRIFIIGEDAFSGLANLRMFSLKNDDNLRSIDVRAFVSTPLLEEISIDFCPNLQTLSPETFVLQRESLNRVSLRGNGFPSLHHLLLDWEKLHFLDIRGNTFNCSSCDIKWLWEFVNMKRKNRDNQARGRKLVEIPEDDTREILCQEPISLRGTPVMDISLENLNCLQDSFLMQEPHATHEANEGGSTSSGGSGYVVIVGAILGALLSSFAIAFLIITRKRKYDKQQKQLRLKEYFTSNMMQPYFSTTTYSETRAEEDGLTRPLKMGSVTSYPYGSYVETDTFVYPTIGGRSTSSTTVINNPYERVIYESPITPINLYQELDSPPSSHPPPSIPPPPSPQAPFDTPSSSRSSTNRSTSIRGVNMNNNSRKSTTTSSSINNKSRNPYNCNSSLNGISASNGMVVMDIRTSPFLESSGRNRTVGRLSSLSNPISSYSSSVVIQHPIKMDSNLYRL